MTMFDPHTTKCQQKNPIFSKRKTIRKKIIELDSTWITREYVGGMISFKFPLTNVYLTCNKPREQVQSHASKTCVALFNIFNGFTFTNKEKHFLMLERKLYGLNYPREEKKVLNLIKS